MTVVVSHRIAINVLMFKGPIKLGYKKPGGDGGQGDTKMPKETDWQKTKDQCFIAPQPVILVEDQQNRCYCGDGNDTGLLFHLENLLD